MYTSTLIATLGTEPQIITLGLDLLIARGAPISQVIVLYLASNEKSKNAYLRLKAEFVGDLYQERNCQIRSYPIYYQNKPLKQIQNPPHVEAVRKALVALFEKQKEQGQQIHLLLSTGRRIMALLALSTAMRYFDSMDRVWHIYTPEVLKNEARGGAIMHAPSGANITLIPVPFVPWGSYLPGLKPVLGSTQAETRAQGYQDEHERRRCQQVWDAISPRQKDTLIALVAGRSRKQAASQINVAISTIDSHKKAILEKCQLAWSGENLKFDIQFLRERFRSFLTGLGKL